MPGKTYHLLMYFCFFSLSQCSWEHHINCYISKAAKSDSIILTILINQATKITIQNNGALTKYGTTFTQL